MEWSIGGLRPDMHRDLVLAHCGSPVRILDEDLWDYLDFAVVFRNHRVVQLVGRRLERHGKQFFDVADPLGDTQAWKALEAMTENRNGHNGIFVSDCLLAHREVPLNSTCGAAPFFFRLLPPRSAPRIQKRGLLLRTRLAQHLGALPWSHLTEGYLHWHCNPESLVLAADWLEGKPGRLSWTPVGLRRALWECLYFDVEYWRAADFSSSFDMDLLVPSASMTADPSQARLLLVGQAYQRRDGLRGDDVRTLVGIDEVSPSECQTVWHRLALAGVWRTREQWKRSGDQCHWNTVIPGLGLSLAAAQARILDRRRWVHALLPEDDRFGNPMDFGWAIAGYPAGMPDWFCFAGAEPGTEPDWSRPEHRFQALSTRASRTLKPFAGDALGPILQTLEQLRQAGLCLSGKRWTNTWCLSLPADEDERELMRRIEGFPHDDDSIPNFALGLLLTADLARRWLPRCHSFEQRQLARGVEIILRLGLQALDLT